MNTRKGSAGGATRSPNSADRAHLEKQGDRAALAAARAALGQVAIITLLSILAAWVVVAVVLVWLTGA